MSWARNPLRNQRLLPVPRPPSPVQAAAAAAMSSQGPRVVELVARTSAVEVSG